MIKKLRRAMRAAFLSMLVTTFGVVSTGAYALSNTTSVVNSGDDAEIESEVESETDIDVENKNEADIRQDIYASSNTGKNDANGNISLNGDAASINTGEATTEVEADVNANSNLTLIGLGNDWGTNNTTDVVNTGDDVEIETEVETETDIDVENDNDADVEQWIKAKSNTGKNDAKGNIGGADINTGNAKTKAEADVNVNENKTFIGGWSDFGSNSNGTSGLLNNTVVTNSGDDAEIESEVESETDIDVENKNDLRVKQGLFGWSNSGKNDAKDNIGEAEVMTGSALLVSRLGVEGNSNTTGIGGSAVSPDSETLTDVVNTGDDLETESETEIEMSVKVENDNELWGSQWFRVKSNTGKNDANGNIGGSLINSGFSGSGAEVEFGGNDNATLLGSLGTLVNLLAL